MWKRILERGEKSRDFYFHPSIHPSRGWRTQSFWSNGQSCAGSAIWRHCFIIALMQKFSGRNPKPWTQLVLFCKFLCSLTEIWVVVVSIFVAAIANSWEVLWLQSEISV
jgi:hypothetical protein